MVEKCLKQWQNILKSRSLNQPILNWFLFYQAVTNGFIASLRFYFVYHACLT